MVIEPKIRGFICTAAHPRGCREHVKQQIAAVQSKPAVSGPKKVLIIGASTGYGLSSRIMATFGSGADTIGVFFEKAASGKRTASAGWYNTAAFESIVNQETSRYAKSINGDAFSTEIKQQTIDLIKKDWAGEVDLVIYSLASPRRTDPSTGNTYHACLKPIGQNFSEKTVDVMQGSVGSVSLEAANSQEIADTTQVMGGDDWQLWMEALSTAGVLADKAITLAYSYIGPELTFPIYRAGTIGKAKEHLEQTAKKLTQQGFNAYVSVNKGLVTQASSAIPVVPLYFSLLFTVMKRKGTHEGCIEQIQRLLTTRLYGENGVIVDDNNLIRLDDWELDPATQSEVSALWQQVTTENLESLSDIKGYREDFHQLFGFGFPNIDYSEDVDVDIDIPSIKK
jgi:enoyl-[acyl-carrier protein] reductase / trans-2-enoyl-CoA reductase (NAD+)